MMNIKPLLQVTCILIFAFPAFLQTSNAGSNCSATLSDSFLLSVPVAIYENQSYWAEIQYLANDSKFELTNAGPVIDTSPFAGCAPSSLSPDLTLQIPTLIFNNIPYSAELSHDKDNYFILTGSGINGTVLLSDDFTGVIADEAIWHIPTWVSPDDGTFIGQTQFRCTGDASLPTVSNGNAVIALDTYNDGSSFYGTDLISNEYVSSGQGILLTVRAKMDSATPKGAVGGIFFYAPPADSTTTHHDELDFELLTNEPDNISTNIYGNEALGPGHPESFALPSGTITDYHDYQILWLPDQVSWFVDGTLLRTVTTQSPIPSGPMYVHFNLWVPAADWAKAYNPALKYADSPTSNQTYSMRVDYVIVHSLNY